MGIGFVIVLWAAVGAVVAGLYLLLSVLGRRFTLAVLMKKVLVAFVAAIVIPFGAWIVISFASGFFPAAVFKSNFGFFPPSDVVDLKGREIIIGDSGEAYLRFRAGKGTVERIIDSRFFEVGRPNSRSYGFPTPDESPSYWRPLEGQSVRFFKSTDHYDDRFGFSQAFLSYDEPTSMVHFYWQGVD